jgi:hypothetical protein
MSASSTAAAAAAPAAAQKTTRQVNRDMTSQVKKNMTSRINELNMIIELAFRTKKQKVVVGGQTYALRQVISMIKKETLKLTKYLELKPAKPKLGDAVAVVKGSLQHWLRSKLSKLNSFDPEIGRILQNTLTSVTSKKIVSRLVSIGIDRGLIASTTSVGSSVPYSPTVGSARTIPSILVFVDESIKTLDPMLAKNANEHPSGGRTILLIQLLSAIGRHIEIVANPSEDERAQVRDDMDFLEQLKKRPRDGEDPEKTALDSVKTKFLMAQIRMMETQVHSGVVADVYREQLVQFLGTEEGHDTLQSLENKISKLKPSKSVPAEKIEKLRQSVEVARTIYDEARARFAPKTRATGSSRTAAPAAAPAAPPPSSPVRMRTPTRAAPAAVVPEPQIPVGAAVPPVRRAPVSRSTAVGKK